VLALLVATDEDGCHFRHIEGQLRQLLVYSELNKAALQQCLDVLETNSDIITTAQQRYITLQ